MKRKVRIAMIGAGQMATRVHYPSLASFDDVELIAVCDLDAKKCEEAAERYQIPHTYSGAADAYQTMIRKAKPDAVYAIGPPGQMYGIWSDCLSMGLHLFIEKPPGITLHQAQALAYLAEKNQCITQVGFQRRSCPMVVKLHEMCLAKGPITHAVCRFYKCEPKPFLGAADHMMDDCVHSIDTLRWICQSEPVMIESMTKRIGVPDINYISAMLHFKNGATGILINSWSSGRRIFSVEMHAPNICVEAEHENKGVVYADGDTDGVVYDTKTVAGSKDFHVYGGFCKKSREFVDGILNNQQPSSCFKDAVKTMEVAHKILAQSVISGH